MVRSLTEIARIIVLKGGKAFLEKFGAGGDGDMVGPAGLEPATNGL